MIEKNKLLTELWNYRKKQKMSLETVARQLGMSLNQINRWSSGRSKPSQLAVERIKHVLGGGKIGGEKRWILK